MLYIKMGLAIACCHPAMDAGWHKFIIYNLLSIIIYAGGIKCAESPREHSEHRWDPAEEQPGVHRGSACCSQGLCQTEERAKRSPMSCPSQCLDLACVNEIVPVTDWRKRRGDWGFGPASHSSILACGLLNFFFFFFSVLFKFCLVRFNR